MKSLLQVLRGQGVEPVMTREPGGTPLAEAIRQLILAHSKDAPIAQAEVLLYAASRAQHVGKVIDPALKKGQWVLCDRYSESTVAFQCFARGLDRSSVDFINRFAEQGRRPDLVVLIDISLKLSRQRQQERQRSQRPSEQGSGPDRIEGEHDEFHAKVREGFLQQAKADPNRFLVLEGTDSPAQLADKLIAELERRGWLGGAE